MLTFLINLLRYNKTENLRAGGRELRSFSHLLVEAKTKYAYNLKHYSDSHNILEAVEAFSHLSFNYQHFPPVKVNIEGQCCSLLLATPEILTLYGPNYFFHRFSGHDLR